MTENVENVDTASDEDGRGVSRRGVLAGGLGVAGLAMAGSAVATAATPDGGSSRTADITVDASRSTPLPHFWEGCIGGDHAKQALRRDFQDQLVRSHRELGVQRIRMHGIFDPQMSVYVADRTKGFTQGDYSLFNVDQIYDFVVGTGMHPYVEVGFMPPDLASDPKDNDGFYYGYNPSPPRDYQEWGRLVTAFTKHCVDRYGLDEVRHWPFEVWNEPNLDFFSGTPAQYNRLYATTATAIKSVDASLQVGGPATDGDGLAYLENFLHYVESHDLPIDFVSSHAYENNSLSRTNGVADVFAPTRKAIPRSLAYYVSETGCNYSNVSDELDTSYAAAFLVKAIDRCDGILDLMSLWCFSDIFEEGSQASNIFFGGFGALTMYGVPKPMYRVFELLHRAGDRRLAVSGIDEKDTIGALAIAGRHGESEVFLYNHAYPGGPAPRARTLDVAVRGCRDARDAVLTRIDAEHANPRQTWFDQGRPLYPSRHQLAAMDSASQLHATRLRPTETRIRGRDHDLTFRVTLPPEGVAVLSLG